MEIRGVGIVDISQLFGVRATRQQKRLEVVVQLEFWDVNASYDRTGLDRQTVDILDVTLPKVVIPLIPGKNITVISEVVAMNHLLRYAGIDSAGQFHQRLRDRMQQAREYLEEDDE
jgi:HPr kinase/phosphorylase